MIKQVIGIATILLVILGVGIVLTKASPRVGRGEVDAPHLSVVTDNDGGLAVADNQRGLVGETNQRFKVSLQNVRVLDERFGVDGRRELLDRLVGDEVNTVRRVVEEPLPTVFDARYVGTYLNDRRNHFDVTAHLNKYRDLALDNTRVFVPYQPDQVLSALRPNDFQEVPVVGKVEVSKELTVGDTLVPLTLHSVEVLSAQVPLHHDVVDADRVVQQDTAKVSGKLGELDLVVV